jgi:hypothetical protein
MSVTASLSSAAFETHGAGKNYNHNPRKSVMNTNTEMKYPNVTVKLVDEDGNAFAILGRCKTAARKAGVDSVEISAFVKEAMSGDYHHLLRTCMKWWNCE